MGLFGLFNKKTVKKTIQGQNMNHLDKDGRLPWGWIYQNKEFCDKIQSEYTYFLNMWLESKSKEPLRRYEGLKSLVLWLEKARTLCYSKGECFGYWFSSIIENDEQITRRQAELDELTDNFIAIESEWKIRQRELHNLDAKIKNLLKENDGILQSEFVKMFDQSVQHEVKEKLYYMDKEGKLQRTKQGRSYSLHLK